MDVQLFLVLVFFLIALFFTGRKIYAGLRDKNAKTCEKCPASSLAPEDKSS